MRGTYAERQRQRLIFVERRDLQRSNLDIKIKEILQADERLTARIAAAPNEKKRRQAIARRAEKRADWIADLDLHHGRYIELDRRALEASGNYGNLRYPRFEAGMCLNAACTLRGTALRTRAHDTHVGYGDWMLPFETAQ